MTGPIAIIPGNSSPDTVGALLTRTRSSATTCPIAYPVREIARVTQKNPDSALIASLTLALGQHHVTAIRALNEKPIVIVHSSADPTQLMVQRIAGRGVAIDSVPPQVVLTLRWSFYRSTFRRSIRSSLIDHT